MNPPANPPSPKPTPSTRVVIKDNSLRTTLIAMGLGIVMLVFVGYGVLHMGSPVQGNKLTGTITEKIFVPQKERRVDFSGRKLTGTKEVEGEYYFKVEVKEKDGEQPRSYQVPVEQVTYDSKKVGDSQTFIRPPSEQK